MSNTKTTPITSELSPLTNYQLCCAVFIHAYQAANDNIPSFIEVAHAFGVHSNTSYETVHRMIKYGVFERAENHSQYRFARTPAGAAYRAQIVAKYVEQGGKA